MWLDMRVSVLCLMVMLILAPVSLVAYDCTDLPNVYTVEDLDVIKKHCLNAPVLASRIYPSATWIIHGYLRIGAYDPLYSEWLVNKTEKKKFEKICIIWLGDQGSAEAYLDYTSISGNCGSSYPIDYADEFNFIDFTSFAKKEVYPFNHSLIQDGEPVPNQDHYILLVQTAHDEDLFTGYQENTQELLEGADLNNKYVKKTFHNNPKRATLTNQCPGWGITNSGQLETCGSIVGPLVYNNGFYGMEKLDINDRPYHHGCFAVENNESEKRLDFLDKLKTGSDYVDRCIGKFANVVRNNKNLCPDPRRYYASMDPDPESLIRTAFLNSEWNKQGVPEVKVLFPEGMTYECVNECSGTINDSISYRDPVGEYGFPCKIFTGDITLMNDALKIPQDDSTRTLQHIREIKGRLTVNAEVDSDVLPQLRIVGGSTVRAPALVLTITDKNIYEAVLPMRLSSVTAKPGTGEAVLLMHSMPHDEIPKTLKDDLARSAGGKDSIKYEKIELHSHKRNHFV